MPHIVRTVRRIWDDLEPRSTPAIPKGTYGICGPDECLDFVRVDFGPPWGIQEIDNADLVDAAAVLLNAKRMIDGPPTRPARPWTAVLRSVSKGFAGPYLKVALGDEEHDTVVEALARHGASKKKALALIDRAVALTHGPTGAPPSTPQAILDGLLADIATSLDAMERAPEMWGSPSELEFQAILLVETRQNITRPRALAANPYETKNAWMRFVVAVAGEEFNGYLFALARETGWTRAEHAKLVADAARWIAQKYPPESA